MVTGFGGGAYFASQLANAYPDTIKGAALISGGPWFLGAYQNVSDGGQFKARVGNLN
jgi:pimeloyl-ACP methyl ester carboxylesterase